MKMAIAATEHHSAWLDELIEDQGDYLGDLPIVQVIMATTVTDYKTIILPVETLVILYADGWLLHPNGIIDPRQVSRWGTFYLHKHTIVVALAHEDCLSCEWLL